MYLFETKIWRELSTLKLLGRDSYACYLLSKLHGKDPIPMLRLINVQENSFMT